MKRKGFTLIELLAVLVILAMIALITIPLILGIIEKARKGAIESSVLNYVETIEKEIALTEINQSDVILDGIYYVGEIEVNYKGEGPEKGTFEIEKNKVVKGTFEMKKYYISYSEGTAKASKNKEDIEDIPEIKSKVYGVKRNLDSESSEWERIEDSVGLIANAQIGTNLVQNDFDSIYPWSDIISYNYDVDSKQITATFGEDNFKFDGSNGEVLTKIPEFYYKREQKEGYEYIYISESPEEGYLKSEEFSVGRYTMSGDTTRIHSRSGIKPLVNHNIIEFREYARNLGSEFGQLDYHYFLIQLLYLVEYADYNSQAKLGSGNTRNSAAIISGGCDALGMKSGSSDGTDTSSMIYRGIEDIYGNIYQFIDGINVQNNQIYVCNNKNSYESDKFDGCYKRLDYVSPSSDGFIKKLGYDSSQPLIIFPTLLGGSDSTYISDNYYQNSGNVINRIARVGGAWAGTTNCGLWYWATDASSSDYHAYTGARLLKDD